MPNSKRFFLILMLTLLMARPAPAPAQVTIDIAKITCEQFIAWSITDPRNILIWLSGFYNGKRNNTVIDQESLKREADKVRDYCRGNRTSTVMQAADTVFGQK